MNTNYTLIRKDGLLRRRFYGVKPLVQYYSAGKASTAYYASTCTQERTLILIAYSTQIRTPTRTTRVDLSLFLGFCCLGMSFDHFRRGKMK